MSSPGTERHANTNFARSSRYGISQNSIKSDGCKKKRHQAEETRQRGNQALLDQSCVQFRGQCADLKGRHFFVQSLDLLMELTHEGVGLLRDARVKIHLAPSRVGMKEGLINSARGLPYK